MPTYKKHISRRVQAAQLTALPLTCFLATAISGQTWVYRETNGPPARRDHAMVYDAARRVCVMFGGTPDYATFFGDTWEWDGATWTLKATTGPAPRWGHAMAYDFARGVSVLFGGYSDEHFGDTWEWDGTGWTHRDVSGPSPRVYHSMVYDPLRSACLVFGGTEDCEGFCYVGDTWEWDGDQWTLRATTGPSPRNAHAMAFDSNQSVGVLFGGTFSYPSGMGDTWEWDAEEWISQTVTGPSARWLHAMAYDSHRRVSLLFGGYDEDRFDGETWEYFDGHWSLRATTGPSPRYRPALAYDSARRRAVLFGGEDHNGVNSETWEYANTCVGTERIQKAKCRDRNGSNTLVAALVGGVAGDAYTCILTDGSTLSGVLNARGGGKGKFNNRPSGDRGAVTVTWECGAMDAREYACP